MFRIYDGRDHFWQWDLNQKLIVEDPTINEVHFNNRADKDSLPVEVYEENGLRLANVPNILLQEDLKIKVYGYSVDHTKHEAWFYVTTKSKPADYVYTETEVINYNSLLDKINGKVDKSDILTEVITDEVFPNNQFYNANAINLILELFYAEFVPEYIFNDLVAEITNKFETKVDKSNVLTRMDYTASADKIYNATVINSITQQNNETFATKAYVNELIGGIENGSY